jgi:predicted dehydrogenase
MSHKQLKISLVGCGAVSKLYYGPALLELERNSVVQVELLFDPNLANIREMQKLFPSARSVNTLDEIALGGADIAIIASPPPFHAQQTIQLLNAGISVLCEKPMAASLAEAEAMIEAASAAKGLLSIGLFRRFFPAAQMIRKILSLGILGELKHFSFSEGGQFQWPVQSPAYFKKATSGGGVLLDVGVHVLDLMIWWFGYPAEFSYEDDAMGGIEVNCLLKLQFSQEFTGEVRLSRDCDLPNLYLIEGSKGWLIWTVNDAVDKIQMGFKDAAFALDAQIHDVNPKNPFTLQDFSNNFEQSFISQICNLIAALKGEEALLNTSEEAVKSLRLIEACYKNRSLMNMPWLSDLESERANQLKNEILC